jgi:DUF1365 family protein
MELALNSSLFDCDVRHTRIEPKPHKIAFRSFMFYIDLDEMPQIEEATPLVGINRASLYSFYESDHLPFGKPTLRDNLQYFLKLQNLDFTLERIMLLTNLRVLGYVFNPISIFYCFDSDNTLAAIVVEVGNTFKELKPYLLTRNDLRANGLFEKKETKHFYVSPFAQLDHTFDFKLKEPGDRMSVTINTMDGEKPVVLASLSGVRMPLTTRALFLLTLKFPLNTWQVIFGIHWHAFLLFLKGLSFEQKETGTDNQIGVLRPHRSLDKTSAKIVNSNQAPPGDRQ